MASAKRSRTRMSPTSRMTDVEPSFLEAKNSILHVVEESMGEKKVQTHRMVCISKIKEGVTPKSVGEHYTEVIKDIPQPEEISGLMLIFPMHCVHILEGANESLLDYMRDVRKQKGKMFTVSKLLVIAHNIQTILFQNWMFHELDIQATGVGEYETSEPMENLVIDIVVNIIKIGSHLSKQPKLSYSSAVQALHERIPESLPQQDVLDYLLERPDPAVQHVEDLLDVYETPYKVVPSAEVVWPMPDHLMPSFS